MTMCSSARSGRNKQRAMQRMTAVLEKFRAQILKEEITDGPAGFDVIQREFSRMVTDHRADAQRGMQTLSNAFDFCEHAFEAEDAILVFVTELTVNYYTARFIGHYGCDKYYMYNKELQLAECQVELTRRVEELNWDL